MTTDIELLRDLSGDWEPPAEAMAAARQRLRAVIANEVSEPARRQLRLPRLALDLRLAPAARVGFAVLVLVLSVTVGSALLAPAPAVARLQGLAVAAEQISLTQLAAGEFAYTRSAGEQLQEIPDPRAPGAVIAFRLPIVREEWRAVDGSGVIRVTTGEPVFLDPADATLLTDDDAAALGIGRTVEQAFGPGALVAFPDLPDEPGALTTVLFREVEKGPRLRPAAAGVFDLAADILRASDVPPQKRAAVLRLLARLDGVELAPSAPGTTTLSISSDVARGREVLTMTFRDAGAVLVGESVTHVADYAAPGMPRRMVISQFEHSPPMTVDRIE